MALVKKMETFRVHVLYRLVRVRDIRDLAKKTDRETRKIVKIYIDEADMVIF